MENIESLDDVGGPLTAKWDDTKPNYNYRSIINFCKEKGIEKSAITDEELQQFVFEKTTNQ